MVLLSKSNDLTTNAWSCFVNQMVLDQKLSKCETVPNISIVSTPKLLKCETIKKTRINSYSERSRAPSLGVKAPQTPLVTTYV